MTPDEKLAEQWLDAALMQYGEAAPDAGLESRILATLEAEQRNRSSFPATGFPLSVGRFQASVARARWFAAVAAVLILTAGVAMLRFHKTGNAHTGGCPVLARLGRGCSNAPASGASTPLAQTAHHNGPTETTHPKGLVGNAGTVLADGTLLAQGTRNTNTSAAGAVSPSAQGGSPGRLAAQEREPRRGGTNGNAQLAFRKSPRRDQFPSPSPLTEEERLLLTYLRTTPKEEILLVAQRQAEQEKELQELNTSAIAGSMSKGIE